MPNFTYQKVYWFIKLLKDILKTIAQIAIEETLFLLTKIYFTLDEKELSKKYASILAYNFPDSDWYKKSYNLIHSFEEIRENSKWYEKFNPIRILKNKENDILDKITIKRID